MFNNYRKRWLSYYVKSQLSKENFELFSNLTKNKIEELTDYFLHKNQWWLIAISTIFIVYFGMIIDFEFLEIFQISLDTSEKIVDQRASNIAAITSITLVVVGFLINNLALKESYAYQLLFKHTHLYPIIYFILTVIGSFFIISTLRDELIEYHFIRAVLMGTYLALSILFLIGFLFRSILHYTNPENILIMFFNELMKQSKLRLRSILYGNLAKELFIEKMKELGLVEFRSQDVDSFGALRKNNLNTDVLKKSRILYDINLEKLKSFIAYKRANRNDIMYFKPLKFNEVNNELDNFIIMENSPNSEADKRILKSCVVLRKQKLNFAEFNAISDFFTQKTEDLVKENSDSPQTHLIFLVY